MQIIKPTLLSLLHRPLLQAGKYHLVVSPLLWFSLSNAEEIVPEQEGWKRMMASLATGETFDVGTPKSNAEALVSGRAYPPVDQRLTSMQVGFEIEGKVSKYVDVHGDQYWVKTNNGWKLSATEPLNALEMTWGNSFGGDGFVDNPLGKGFYDTDKINQIDHIAVPNIRSKNEIYDRLNNNHRPIGFGPIDIMRPVRQKRAGTYDEQWLEQGYPGLAADHDPAIYNVAQTDQWAESYFCGDENYEIHGMSSTEAVLKGKLPAMKCRVFIQTSSGKTNELQEVSTHIDTVWFFPEQDIGLIISRGTVEIEDSDGLDVQLLMTAFERMGDEPRTINHYQNVHRLRTDPETAVAHLMNESQLVPNKTAEQVQRYQTEIENARKVRKDRIKKHLDDIEANHNVDSPGTKALSLPAQDVDILDLDSLPIISPEAIARGDIDLTDAIAGLKKMADDCKSEGDKALTQLDQVDRSNASLKSTKAAQSLAQLEGRLRARFEPIQESEFMSIESQHQIQAAKLAGRKASPMDSTEAQNYADDAKQYLRERVIKIKQMQGAFNDLDLSGADLHGLDFRGSDFTGVMLESANLANCNFSGVAMNGAIMTSANLEGAVFDNCSFSDVNLSMVNAPGASFRNSEFKQVTAIRSNFRECDFSNCSLEAIALVECNLDQCCLKSSTFLNVQFCKTSMSSTQWQFASLKQSIFVESQLVQASFSQATLVRCIFLQVDASGSDFSGSNLDRVQFGGATLFDDSDFSNITGTTIGFRGVDLSGCSFVNAAIKESDFGNCKLVNVNMNGAGFLRCIFSGARLAEIHAVKSNFMESLMRKSCWINADLRHSEFFSANLKESSFSNCDLRHAKNLSLPIGETL